MSDAASITHIRRVLRDHMPEGDDETFELTLELARHAALPAALNAALLHLLRINFVQDAPQTAEVDLLLSPICSEIGDDLFEIEAGVRNALLRDLTEHHARDGRLQDVARLLSQYNRRCTPWADQPELELAQRVTALNFLNPDRVREWMDQAEQSLGGTRSLERAWFIAMQQEIERVEADVRITPVGVGLPAQTVVALLSTLRGEFPQAKIGVFLYDAKNQTLTLDPASEEFYQPEYTLHQPISLAPGGGRSIAGRAIMTHVTQNVSDVSRDPDYVPLNRATHSELAVPIERDQELVGVVVLESPLLRAFDARDAAFVEAVCSLLETTSWRGAMWWDMVAHQNAQSISTIRNSIFVINKPGLDTAVAPLLASIDDCVAQISLFLQIATPFISASDILTFSALIGTIRYHAYTIEQQVDGDALKSVQLIERVGRKLAHSTFDNSYTQSETIALDAWLGEQLEQLVDAPGVEWAFKPGGADAAVRVAPKLLGGVLDILVSNAIQAMNSSGRIEVRTQRVGTTAEITIADSGPGIPEDLLQQVFRERISTKGVEHGMGLLLAQTTIEGFGGRLELRSSSSEGTTFALTLPIENAPVRSATGVRVLVVDPDEAWRLNLADLLVRHGYNVVVAEGQGEKLVQDAIDKARRYRCHIAITDLRLEDPLDSPDRSGLDLVTKITPTATIILATYITPAEVATALRDAGAMNVIGKEEGPKPLLEAIEQVAQRLALGEHSPDIRWLRGGTARRVFNFLFAEQPDGAETEVSEVIARLFPNARDIVLDTLEYEHVSAFSLSQELAPRRQSIAFQAVVDDQASPLLVKIGQVAVIAREADNFEHYVRNRFANPSQPYLYARAQLWNIGALAYTVVGGLVSRAQSFAQYYQASSRARDVVQPLLSLFGDSIPDMWWHAPNVQNLGSTLFEAYDKLWLGALSNRFDTWQHDPPQHYLAGLSFLLPNPTYWLAKHWHRSGEIVGARQAVTHGDLHGDNVLVDQQQHAWMIDFERTGPGPILRDFVELIQDVLTRLAQLDDVVLRYELAVALCAPSRPDAYIELTEAIRRDHEAYKAFQVVQNLEKLAHERTKYVDRREYLWGLLLNSVYGVRMLEHNPRRDHLLLLASVICGRLQQWNDPTWPPRSWRQVRWVAPTAGLVASSSSQPIVKGMPSPESEAVSSNTLLSSTSTREEEVDLIRRARAHDTEALTQLLTSLDPQVRRVARNRIKAYRVPERLRDLLLPEVEQVGRLALVDVVLRKFDLDTSFRLWTYAEPRVKGVMSDYLEKEQRRWRHLEEIESSGLLDDRRGSAGARASVIQASVEDATIAAVDWPDLMHQVIRRLGPQDSAKFIALAVLSIGERLQWHEIVTLLTVPLEPPWFEWPKLHRSYHLSEDVPDSWSEIYQLFQSGPPRLAPSEPEQAANSLRKWYTRRRMAVRRGLNET